MKLAIEAIDASGHNARQTQSDMQSDNELRASIEALGMIQPIVVAKINGDDLYRIVAGNRRLAAAKELGWAEVPVVVHDDLDEDHLPDVVEQYFYARSAAENMVRRPMHPVDTWRAVDRLLQSGMTLENAGLALGLAPALTRRLAHLAHLAPEVIAAIEKHDQLPQESHLRVIAMAPIATQQKAMQKHTRGREVEWWNICNACRIERLPLSLTIFDPATAGVTFDEDLFAQPDADDRYTTTEIDKFMAAQREALKAQAEASKGRLVYMAWAKEKQLRDRLPKGWRATYDAIPKRWKKDDQRRAFACVDEQYQFGKIMYVVGVPIPQRPPEEVSDTASDTPEAAPRPREPMTKAVHAQIAVMKRAAVVEALPDFVLACADRGEVVELLRAVLLLFAAENLDVQNTQQAYGRRNLAYIVNRLIEPDGTVSAMTAAEICTIAAEVIAMTVMFDHPNATVRSGDAAEWIAGIVRADQFMQRCDTDEILKGCSGDLLVSLAREHGIDDTGKVSDVRKRLVGHLPDWRPAQFGAEGPRVQPIDDDEEEGDGEPSGDLSDEMSDEQEAVE